MNECISIEQYKLDYKIRLSEQWTAVCPYQHNLLGVRPPKLCVLVFLQP